MEWMLILIVFGMSMQDIVKKIHAQRALGSGVYSFAAATTLVALLFFVIRSGGKLAFSAEYLPYSLGFGISYVMGSVFYLLAVRHGPLSLTALMISLSLILPSLYGLLVLGEPVSLFLIAGIILLLAALFLINLEKKGVPKQITFKWILFATLASLGNGCCSIFQKAMLVDLGDTWTNSFMVTALLLASISMLIMAVAMERKALLANLKTGLPWYTLCGIANGAVNLLIIVLSAVMPASVMFPVLSAGGIVLTFFISVLVYKERLSRWQLLGVLLGVVSVVLLNL